jgi:hypothetical protein
MRFEKILSLAWLFTLVLWNGCSTGSIGKYENLDHFPNIEPDYTELVLPFNIAPLNFIIKEDGEQFHVELSGKNGESIRIEGDSLIQFPVRKWKQLLKQNKGDSISINIFLRKNGEWLKFRTIHNYVAPEKVDHYLAYRLIEPLYEVWGQMGIYQRNLESFDEEAIFTNRLTKNQCMNCHSFQSNNPKRMMFHLRGPNGGTMFINGNSVEKVNTKTRNTLSAGVYPAWHPHESLVAYSVNDIGQMFHSRKPDKVEVLDVFSDLIIYDVKSNKVKQIVNTRDTLETFPSWSPDGKWLYYCSAALDLPGGTKDIERSFMVSEQYDKIRYSVMRRKFDAETLSLGKPDTVISAGRTGKSASFPRISPDGHFLLITFSDYGNFSIWHKSSDLYLMDLKTGELKKPEGLNSNDVESYHSWSSNSRWIVFSSRRDNGSYTRPYLAYVSESGQTGKPFVLPQKSPDFYELRYKSFNIPEFITGPVSISIRRLEKVGAVTGIDASFIENSE